MKFKSIRDRYRHYWDFIKNNCTNLDTVKFINFHPKSGSTPINTLAIRWVLIALYHLEDLQAVIHQILSDHDFLMMYCVQDSFIW